jgi:hypothetical protein
MELIDGFSNSSRVVKKLTKHGVGRQREWVQHPRLLDRGERFFVPVDV